jgi:hypothetical protein
VAQRKTKGPSRRLCNATIGTIRGQELCREPDPRDGALASLGPRLKAAVESDNPPTIGERAERARLHAGPFLRRTEGERLWRRSGSGECGEDGSAALGNWCCGSHSGPRWPQRGRGVVAVCAGANETGRPPQNWRQPLAQ